MRPGSTALSAALACLASTSLAPTASALSITYNYDYDPGGFFNANRRAVLESVASVYEGLFRDVLLPITSGGTNRFDAKFLNPSSGVEVVLESYSIPDDEVIVFVGAYDIPGTPLAVASSGYSFTTGSAEFVATVQSRGQLGALDSPASDFGPWGGSIAFDSPRTWFEGLDASMLPGNQYDLFSVALHEMAHLLGFGVAESWEAQVDAPGGVGIVPVFEGSYSTAAYGGPVLLANDKIHWRRDTFSTIPGTVTLQEAAMDPDLVLGTRKVLTELDIAGLQDVGWTLVPLPASLVLLLSAGLGTLPFLRRVRSNS